MEDVKAERASFGESGKGGKKKRESFSAEERNKVLVKLISKERVLEFLRETMAVQKERTREESEEIEENDESESSDESEKTNHEEDNAAAEGMTRALPPSRWNPVPTMQSTLVKASFLHSYLA